MQKSGYLHQNFRLFHIRDKKDKTFDFHFHDFNKIIIFLSGNVTYIIEGKTYYLKPWDILLVDHHSIHKPIIDPSVYYERIVIWVDEDYMLNASKLPSNQNALSDTQMDESQSADITACFKKASERSYNLIRLNPVLMERLQSTISSLERTLSPENDQEFGITLLRNALFMEFMVYINQIYLGKQYEKDHTALKYDQRIEEILKYINSHLSEDLSVDTLAELFFLSRYHLMHKFKEETGYTVHNYILQKRLLLVKDYTAQGMPITKAALASGFTDYSTYHRAAKKLMHEQDTEHTEDS